MSGWRGRSARVMTMADRATGLGEPQANTRVPVSGARLRFSYAGGPVGHGHHAGRPAANRTRPTKKTT